MAAPDLFHHLDRFPPVVLRLFARHKFGPPLTSREIAERAGLSEYKVVAISSLTSWDEVSVHDMRAFLQGCGIDFGWRTMNRINSYLRSKTKTGSPWRHLRKTRDGYMEELLVIAMQFIAKNWKTL